MVWPAFRVTPSFLTCLLAFRERHQRYKCISCSYFLRPTIRISVFMFSCTPDGPFTRSPFGGSLLVQVSTNLSHLNLQQTRSEATCELPSFPLSTDVLQGLNLGFGWVTQGHSKFVPEATLICLGRMLWIIVMLKGEPLLLCIASGTK